LPFIIQGLQNGCEESAIIALEALRILGPFGVAARPAVLPYLRSRRDGLDQKALAALEAFGAPDLPTAQALESYLIAPMSKPHLDVLALEILATRKPVAGEAISLSASTLERYLTWSYSTRYFDPTLDCIRQLELQQSYPDVIRCLGTKAYESAAGANQAIRWLRRFGPALAAAEGLNADAEINALRASPHIYMTPLEHDLDFAISCVFEPSIALARLGRMLDEFRQDNPKRPRKLSADLVKLFDDLGPRARVEVSALRAHVQELMNEPGLQSMLLGVSALASVLCGTRTEVPEVVDLIQANRLHLLPGLRTLARIGWCPTELREALISFIDDSEVGFAGHTNDSLATALSILHKLGGVWR